MPESKEHILTESDLPVHDQGKSFYAMECPKCKCKFPQGRLSTHVCKPKKVLIACPTLGLDPDPDRWLNSLIKILNNVRREGFTHAVFCPYRQNWWPANNEIWDTAFANKFDYILRIDDDIHGVPDDAFTKLLVEDKDVIGAAYCNRRFPYTIQAMIRTDSGKDLISTFKDNDQTLRYAQWHGYKGTEVQRVELIGFGMTLIKVAAFKYLERPMYKGEEVCPDDSYFAQVCLDNNIEQFVHWGVRLKHAHVTFANSGLLYNADVLEAHPDINEKSENVFLAEPNEPEKELENAKT